jgi:hypothetical protein
MYCDVINNALIVISHTNVEKLKNKNRYHKNKTDFSAKIPIFILVRRRETL